MKILLCPGTFKGSFSAAQVAKFLESNISIHIDEQNLIKSLPMADGGEGSLEILADHIPSCKKNLTLVPDPLNEGFFYATWLLSEESQTAFIEAAKIVGYRTLGHNILLPRFATSFGLGLVMADAVACGAKELVIMLGDTIILDAGFGCINALGGLFLNSNGDVLQLGDIVENLKSIFKVNFSNCVDFSSIHLTLAVDTKTPLCGSNGLVNLYGAQKGVIGKDFGEFENAIVHYADIIELETGNKLHNFPGASAGGGIAASLCGFLKAEVISGFDFLAGLVNLDKLIAESDLVITGEGRIDQQTVYGKVPWGISKICKRYGVPVIAITGSLQGITEFECGLDMVFETQKNGVGNNVVDMIETIKHVSDFINSRNWLPSKLK